jgi:chromosome segregation ATPase
VQGDFESHRKLAEQQQAQIEHYANLASQLSQSQQQKQQAAEAFEEDDPYADPMEKRIRQLERLIEGSSKTSSDRVAQLETQLQDQTRTQHQAQLEREYNQRVDLACTKFPRASRNDIETDMFRSKKVDKRAVEHFAKRSQERADEHFRQRLRSEGYKAPPKQMLSAGTPGAKRTDYGDDLEAAHAGALEALLGSNH